MKVIQVSFYGNVVYVSLTGHHQGNLNTCRVTENNSFLFSIDYIEKNLETLQFYINPIMRENQVKCIVLETTLLLNIMKLFINVYPNLTELRIKGDNELSTSDCKDLMELKNICDIECYDMDEKLYHVLSSTYNKNIQLRGEILFESNFMDDNGITTYSNLYLKKQVIIKTELDSSDKKEFEYFLKNNHCLEKVNVLKYSQNNIKFLTSKIKNKNVIISILNDGGLENRDYRFLKKQNRKNKVTIELEYSKQYQQDHAMKQLNLNMLRFAMVVVLFICVGFVSIEHFTFEKNKDNIEKIDLTPYEELANEEPVIEIKEEPVEEKPEEEVINIEESNEEYINPYYTSYSQKFAELKAMNSDTVGWIKVNNTNVNYPVVQASDNDYYLNHSFDGSYNTFGWIYADYRSHFDILNQNTILYGHNVLGTDLLFGSLEKTIDATWYNNPDNLVITFNTEVQNMKWQIFSIYVVPVTNDYLITNFNSETSFLSFVQELKDRSVKDFGVEVEGKSQILTLSTCYKNSDYRVVIHAKRI